MRRTFGLPQHALGEYWSCRNFTKGSWRAFRKRFLKQSLATKTHARLWPPKCMLPSIRQHFLKQTLATKTHAAFQTYFLKQTLVTKTQAAFRKHFVKQTLATKTRAAFRKHFWKQNACSVPQGPQTQEEIGAWVLDANFLVETAL